MSKGPKYSVDYYLDSVGRRRKLSHGAMESIRRAYAKGGKTADLAEAYGVSTSLIRTVTYNTARETDPIIPGIIHKDGYVNLNEQDTRND